MLFVWTLARHVAALAVVATDVLVLVVAMFLHVMRVLRGHVIPVADCHRHLVFGGVRGVEAHGLGHGGGGRSGAQACAWWSL